MVGHNLSNYSVDVLKVQGIVEGKGEIIEAKTDDEKSFCRKKRTVNVIINEAGYAYDYYRTETRF